MITVHRAYKPSALHDVSVTIDYKNDELCWNSDGLRYRLPEMLAANVSLSFSHGCDVPRHKVVSDIEAVVRDLYGIEDDALPKADKVIFSGPATVMLWPDGTKTITKRRDGDENDYVFGMLACILRKLTRNRGHAVDENEDALREMAKSIDSMEDLDALLDYAQLMLDTLTVLRESSVLWVDQLGEPEPTEPEVPEPMVTDRSQEIADQLAQLRREVEELCKEPIDFSFPDEGPDGGDGHE